MADIVCYAGQGFIERSRRWIAWQHQKVLLAIARCRSPRLVHLLELPCLWRLHARRPTTLRNSTAAPFSTPHPSMRRMRKQLQPRSPRVLRHEHPRCVSTSLALHKTTSAALPRRFKTTISPHSAAAIEPHGPKNQPCNPYNPPQSDRKYIANPESGFLQVAVSASPAQGVPPPDVKRRRSRYSPKTS